MPIAEKRILPTDIRKSEADPSWSPSQHEHLRKPPTRSSSPKTSGQTPTRHYADDEVVFVRLPEVKALTGLSKTSLYAQIRAQSFPAAVRIGPRTVAWVKSEIRQWAANRLAASRSNAPILNEKRSPHCVIGTIKKQA